MQISTWAIKNPIPSSMLFVLLTFLGLFGFQSMKIQNFPDIDLPTVNVVASLPGAAPGQLETEVARKIENAVANVQGVRNIYTRLQEGTATITVEFRLEKPVQEAVDDVRDAISRIRSDLPGDLLDPVISRLELSGAPMLTFTVASSRLDDEALSWFVDNTVSKAVLSVSGVGAISRVGGVTREVRVELDPMRLMALGTTAAEISRQLRAVQQDAASGRTDLGGAEQAVRTLATVESAEELAALQLTLADGRLIRLDDVARVVDGVSETRAGAFMNGEPVVAFEISRSRGAGEIEVAQNVKAVLERLQAETPHITFTEAFNLVDPVQENYDGSMALLYEGALLAILVVWFFLRNFRATFIAATALPLSILPAFGLMYFLGFSINVVTLLSLSLVVGILVDDAIVEIENIMRHLRMGKSPLEAAREAAEEIGLAVVATTATLIAVFLPTAFMSGVAGKFFVQFGWTASIAVFFSLVVARMLTPLMAAYMLKPSAHEEKEPGWLAGYLKLADWCLRHRILATLAALAFVFFALSLVPRLPTGFIPPDDFGQTQVTINLPPGSTYDQSRAVAERAWELIADHPHVRNIYTAIGGGASGGDPFAPQGAASPTRVTLTLQLTPRTERRGLRKQEIEAELRTLLAELPGVRLTVGLGGSGEKYVLVLAGEDGRVLVEHARQVERELRSLPGIGSVTSSASLVRPELIVRPDFARAADLGVTTAAIADTLRIATRGDFDQALPKLNLSQRQIPIVVRLADDARTDPDLLSRLQVPGASGPVLLGQVATIELAGGPAEIARYSRMRNVNFEIELNGQALGEIEQLALALPSLQNLPPGVIQTTIGDAEAMNELFASFALAMGTGILCIYIVLVLLFKDFMQPVTILAALILSIPGAFLALYLTGKGISMPSMIGLIMLMGIATKNSILLVDYVLIARAQGLARHDALIDACRKRARPIIMTTIAMGAGMMPIALGFNADPSFRAPMAIVVIGGLITSTFLSLLVIPVIFSYIDDLKNIAVRLWRGRKELEPNESLAQRDPAVPRAAPTAGR